MITMWAGLIGAVPPGWHLCDGTDGTPDLIGKFIPASGPLFAVGDEGGGTWHDHTFTADGHQARMDNGPHILADGAIHPESTPSSLTGSTNFRVTSPRYYALAYIQYLGT